jgi:nitric oxide synthase-interacting protein
MTRHSKNNSRNFFSSSERSKLKGLYGTITERIGKDSLKSFDDCSLCLSTAKSPVCCPKGHLYCKECILKNILDQKKNQKTPKPTPTDEDIKIMDQNQKKLDKFLDQDLIIKKKTELKEKNSAFWIPQNQPKNETKTKENFQKILCHIGDHTISSKKLLTVKFKVKDEICSCPVCNNDINAGMKIALLKPCGHVVCTKCIARFLGTKKCPVCDLLFTGTVDLQQEGTGFSAGGQAQSVKETLPYI